MRHFKICLGIFSLLLSACGSEPSPKLQFSRQEKIDLMADIRDFGDLLRDYGLYDFGLLSDPNLSAVTLSHGFSVIRTNQLPIRSEVAIASPKPWSSWWYPKREDLLFRDSNSTLAKYDLYRRKRWEQIPQGNPPGSAVAYERKVYQPNSASWEGLCDAWSLASITQMEPKRPVTLTIRGISITFGVADLKALLLKTYEAVDDSSLKYYGQKFTGNFSGWIHPDIFPEQFHRFLEIQLFGKKRPFIMDRDAGVEVWNVPVYKANYVISGMPNEPDSVFVRAWLTSAESTQNTEKDFIGTKEMIREYDYVLKGTRNADGDLVINSGHWIKGPDGVDSRNEHPDYLIQLSDTVSLVRKSWNPELDVRLVDEILSQSY